MGVVYEARGPNDERVALKIMMSAGPGTREADIRRFRAGADAAHDLKHANIVRVLSVGEDRGRHFLTMPLIDGVTLAQDIAASGSRPRDAREAAALLAGIARAVQYAHAHGVLHRDLTPANIILDRDRKPLVTDFGLARRMGSHGSTVSSAATRPGAGTLRYMAPEQASAKPKNLTFAADIYALGAMLFELLTGKVPIEADDWDELLGKLASSEPVRRPRSLVPDLDPNLESICRRCLEKEPRARYESAKALAADLRRWLAGRKPIHARRSVWSRTFSWVARHPRRTLTALAVIAGVSVVVGIRERAERDEWTTNASFASAQAGTMLYQLREYADRVTNVAADPGVIALFGAAQARDRAPSILDLHSRQLDTDLFLMGRDGYLLAQAPLPTAGGIFDRSYLFRDYFRGAGALGAATRRGAYVARTMRSESDGKLKFGFSAPVFSGDDQWIGVLVALKDASSVFGEVQLVDPASDGRRMTALLGPRDRERNDGPDAPLPTALTFVVHPALTRAEEHVLGVLRSAFPAGFGAAAPPGAQFNLRYVQPHKVHDYDDPPPGLGGGRLAAFAPVGDTGYVVLVQSRTSGSGAPASATTSGSAKTRK